MTVIEVFADVGCPFAHIGLRRFVDGRREMGRDDVVLHVRAWPLEIVNGKPLDPHFIAEEVEEIRAQISSPSFAQFRESAFPASSLPAMSLAAAAYEQNAQTGEAVSLELRDLLFEQGVDIADPAVLAQLTEKHGVKADLADSSRVMADHADGVKRGVIGSPHFFTATASFFCPSLDVHRDASGHLHVSFSTGFDEFFAACLER